jgi:hypothetical protein
VPTRRRCAKLELERGNASDLFDVAREFIHALPAQLAFKSKLERGYELIDGEQGAPVELEVLMNRVVTPIKRRNARWEPFLWG